MIKGLEKLNKKQIQELFRCNNEQKDCICDREQKRPASKSQQKK